MSNRSFSVMEEEISSTVTRLDDLNSEYMKKKADECLLSMDLDDYEGIDPLEDYSKEKVLYEFSSNINTMPGSLLSDDDILRSNDCDYLNLFMKAHRIVSYYVLSEDDYLKHDSNLRYVHSVVAADFSFGVRLLHSYFLNVMKDLAAISSKKGAGALSFDILCGGAIKNYKNSDTGNFFRDAKSCSDNNSRLYSVFKRDMKILNR